MHKPTFHNAIGGEHQGGNFIVSKVSKINSRDLPGQLTVKYRNKDEVEEIKGSFTPSEVLESLNAIRAVDIPIEELNIVDEGPSHEEHEDQSPEMGDNDESSSVIESDSDSEDDEAALLQELEKVRQERAAEKAEKEALLAAEEDLKRREAVLTGNPLLLPQDKKAWYEDTVFRRQAQDNSSRRGPKKRFINDTVRSDFHRRFLAKYIQ